MHTNGDDIDPKVLADLGYERRDLDISVIGRAAIWFFGFTLGSGLIGGAFIWGIKNYTNYAPEPKVEQRPFTRVQPPAGYPILQNNTNNTADITELRKHEAEVLTTSGQSSDHGFYHIPVDDAMNLIATRGLPKVNATGQTVPTPAQRKSGTGPKAPPASMPITGSPEPAAPSGSVMP